MSLEVLNKEMDRWRGQSLELIEALGLSPAQERSVKGTLKQLSYSAQKNVRTALEDDTLSAALEEAHIALKELQRQQAIIKEHQRLHRPIPPTEAFVSQRLQATEDQIKELSFAIRVKDRYA